MMKWIYDDLRLDKPGLALICFWVGNLKRLIWVLWSFQCLKLYKLQCFEGPFFFGGKKPFTQPDMNEAGQFLDNFSNLSPT